MSDKKTVSTEEELKGMAEQARGQNLDMSIPTNLAKIYNELHLLNNLLMYSIAHNNDK